jgi:predicted tellurium resistance membrane protein TerC
MEHLLTADSLISFLTLTLLEVILGIDNVIFVSIIMGRLAAAQQKRARLIWMITGILSRSALLLALGWLLSRQTRCLPFLTWTRASHWLRW